LNDHDRVLLEPRRQPFHLKAFVTSRATDYTRIGFVRMAVRDPTMLSAAVQRIEELPDDIIRTGVRRIPGVWLDEHQRTLVEDFLLARRDALRAAFNATPHAYTALQGGGI
jgi:hypothetical protein